MFSITNWWFQAVLPVTASDLHRRRMCTCLCVLLRAPSLLCQLDYPQHGNGQWTPTHTPLGLGREYWRETVHQTHWDREWEWTAEDRRERRAARYTWGEGQMIKHLMHRVPHALFYSPTVAPLHVAGHCSLNASFSRLLPSLRSDRRPPQDILKSNNGDGTLGGFNNRWL